jgi:hypothetical protein
MNKTAKRASRQRADRPADAAAPLGEAAAQPTSETPSPSSSSKSAKLMVSALAALVMRQARASLIEGQMIAGIDKKYGSPVGLLPEDRSAMALVSRALLSQGLADHASEIHDLLANCTKPLGEWLPILEVTGAGLSYTRLISRETGAPTAEAEELAKGFSTLVAGVEELLFGSFVEMLEKQSKASAYEYYTAVRGFIVRHPVATGAQIKEFASELPSNLWMLVAQQFYEPVPFAWSTDGFVTLCGHCSNGMRQGAVGRICRTSACAAAEAAREGGVVAADDLFRVTRGIAQYWVEPGIDELRLFDALTSQGISAELYPFMDRVDIAVGAVGIDLKTYASPELLGEKIRRSKGGLAHYEKKWLVIPDWLVQTTPQYLDRLRHAMEETAGAVRCLSLGQAVQELTRA